jgi:hypothetical protein
MPDNNSIFRPAPAACNTPKVLHLRTFCPVFAPPSCTTLYMKGQNQPSPKKFVQSNGNGNVLRPGKPGPSQ